MELLCWVTNIFLLLMFARIIMSWFPPTPDTTYARIYEFFYTVTEPVLAPVRSMLPPMRVGGAGLDFSPIVVLIAIMIIQSVVC